MISIRQVPQVTPFFDTDTATFSYVIKDPLSKACAVIDPVLNLDYPCGSISHHGADRIVEFITTNRLQLQWLIETHVHADHLSAASYIQKKLGGKIAVGARVTLVQEIFGRIFNADAGFKRDGSQFDHLFNDGESYKIGNLQARAVYTPGHTPACTTHIVGDAAFVGDTLFMPDQGTARADFPGGDACTLFRSVRKLLALPPATRVFICHDYARPDMRPVKHVTTVAEQKANNIHVRDGIDEIDFVQMRHARDAAISMPGLILPSLQVNMRAGQFPPPEDNGIVYLKVPLNVLTNCHRFACR